MRVGGVVKLFQRPFGGADAQAHVIFLFEMEHRRFRLLTQSTQKPETGEPYDCQCGRRRQVSSPKISKPTGWRGGVQNLEDVERYVKPMKSCEEKRKEWAKHWQCNTEVPEALVE